MTIETGCGSSTVRTASIRLSWKLKKQVAHQLVGPGETMRHSTLISRETFSVISGNHGSNHGRIIRLFAGCSHFMQLHFAADRKQFVM